MHGRELDWTKVREVSLALLWLGRQSDRRRVPCRTSQSLLDGFYEDGLIDDPRAVLGTVEFTEEGVIEAERMLRKHFQKRTDAGTEKGIDARR